MSKSPGIPGTRTVFSNTPRNVLFSDVGVIMARGVMDSTYAYDGKQTRPDEIVPGCLMAFITGTNKWCPLKRTRVASGSSGSGTGAGDVNLKVSESRFFKAGDLIKVTTVAGAVDRVISSVDYDTDTIVLTAAVDNTVVGGAVYARSTIAGAETCLGVLDSFVKLMDEDGVWRDKLVSNIVIAGYIEVDSVLGDLTAARADTAAKLANLLWTDQHGEDA